MSNQVFKSQQLASANPGTDGGILALRRQVSVRLPSGWFLALILLIGLVLRLGILTQTSNLGVPIVDEQHYAALASGLLERGEFGSEPGIRTSMRPPLYPAFVAGTWAVAGKRSFQATRLAQVLSSLASVAILYWIGARIFSPAVGLLAAAMLCFYPSLVISNFLLLTETLFTLLILLTLAGYVRLLDDGRPGIAVMTGAALGCAALTRSVLWPFPVLMVPVTFLSLGGTRRRRAGLSLLILTGYAIVVAPWAIRNTRLQKTVTIVDTMGGRNLRMGNYEHTPEDRIWDAISLEGDLGWAAALHEEQPGANLTEGQKDKWAQRKAVEYMRHHPLVTLKRSAIKFADFWGLERDYAAGLLLGLYRPAPALAVLTVVAILLSYPVVMFLAIAGIYLAPPADKRVHLMLLLVVGFITAIHVLVFGHSRYHLPVMPILMLFAASGGIAIARRDVRFRMPEALAPVATAAVLVGFWVRQVLVVDYARVTALIKGLG
jgi:4-amino-4-deoxy-L-arabinose transferase-like glycosyltransferase